jgi:hypothetical protein
MRELKKLFPEVKKDISARGYNLEKVKKAIAAGRLHIFRLTTRREMEILGCETMFYYQYSGTDEFLK